MRRRAHRRAHPRAAPVVDVDADDNISRVTVCRIAHPIDGFRGPTRCAPARGRRRAPTRDREDARGVGMQGGVISGGGIRVVGGGDGGEGVWGVRVGLLCRASS